MIKYELKDEKIIKTGSEIEFTAQDILNDIVYLEKTKKEITAKVGIEKATMENVKGTHPHIAEMSIEDLTAAFLYRQSSGYIHIAEEKLAEIEKQLADYEVEKKEIEKQTGIDFNKITE